MTQLMISMKTLASTSTQTPQHRALLLHQAVRARAHRDLPSLPPTNRHRRVLKIECIDVGGSVCVCVLLPRSIRFLCCPAMYVSVADYF